MKKNFLTIKKVSFPFSSQLKILFNSLLKEGDELRIVGGAVRDFLRKNDISDIDLACQYLPEKTSEILQNHGIKVVNSGVKYGTITAIIDGKEFQITTLRKDVETFGRKAEVEFTDDFYEDAARRDFTINAMSIDFAGNLYDYFDGINDLQKGIVRFIGDAEDRIKEDYLRILRFFRFSCKYVADVDISAFQACSKYKDQINNLSVERIREEFFKILQNPNRENLIKTLSVMKESGILKVILMQDVDLRPLENLFELEKKLKTNFDILLILAILQPSRDFKLSNADKRFLDSILKPQFIIDFSYRKKDLLKLLMDFDQEMIVSAFILQLVLDCNFKNFIDDFLTIKKLIETSQIPDFPIDGNDLKVIAKNPQDIGKLLKIAKNYWWENDFTPEKTQILSYLKSKN